MKVHLVTTALPERNDDNLPTVLLGTWCRKYETDRWGQAVQPFHWNDRGKLHTDYEYLRQLHSRLIATLAGELSELHGTSADERYWQTIVDPWLLTYLGTMFDRWEAIRVALEQHDGVVVDRARSPNNAPPVGWSDFIAQTADDHWNQEVFAEILTTSYDGRVDVRFHDEPRAAAPPSEPRRFVAVRAVLASARNTVERLLCDRNRVLFHRHDFSVLVFVAINLSLGQWPRLRSAFPEIGNLARVFEEGKPSAYRKSAVALAATNAFEKWLFNRLKRDLPISCLEGFAHLRERAEQVSADCSIIFTTTAIWTDEAFKIWAAGKVADGCRLIVSEHGGSLPARSAAFDYEESVSDTKVTWFTAFDPKHVQLPAAKFLGWSTAGHRRVHASDTDCVVIVPDFTRYAFRAAYAAVAGQIEDIHDLILKLEASLSPDLCRSFKVKTAPGLDRHRNTVRWFRRHLGTSRVMATESLAAAVRHARVIVCTYPETTFSEAMVTGRPVMMLYPPHYYERHPAAERLLAQLIAAGIVHHHVASAADHLNQIWNDPNDWWTRDDVVAARRAFMNECLGHSTEGRAAWVDFFKREIGKPSSTPNHAKSRRIALRA